MLVYLRTRLFDPRSVSGLRPVRPFSCLAQFLRAHHHAVYTSNLFQALHYDRQMTSKRVRLFWIIFAVMFCWEIIPECPSFRACYS